jgi:GAF domain-containing protein/HAMP domain-containing protein
MSQVTASHPRRAFPIRLRLALGFIIAVTLPTLMTGALFLFGRQDIDRSNIESYVSQVGQKQRQQLTSVFAIASDTLMTFSTAPDTNRMLVGLLLNNTQTAPSLPTTSVDDARDLLTAELLNTPTTRLFSSLQLLDRNGMIVAAVADDNVSVIETFDTRADASASAAYRRITAAQVTAPMTQQVMVVTPRDGANIEIVQAVNLRGSENSIGYLVATVNIATVINPRISFNDQTYDAYSFLQTPDGIQIGLSANTEAIARSQESIAVERARSGITGFSRYRLDGGTGEEVIGYYTNIQETPFILVTQVPTAGIVRQIQAYFFAGGFAIATGVVAITVISLVFLYGRYLTEPIDSLRQAMQGVIAGNFDVPLPEINRTDEFGDLAQTFVDMRQQQQTVVQDLQARINRRTRDVETTQEISHVAVTQRDLNRLMDDVVALIVDRFSNIYHAQIFLLDRDNRYAILRASTGDVGKQLLSRGHRLAVGSISVIGQVTSQGEVIIARDANTSEVHRRNEFLPDTRAELALPLRVGNEIIGALDVQSRENATFDKDQVTVLQIMADQIAVAIENARLYQESIRRIRSSQQTARAETIRSWQDYMYDQKTQRMSKQVGIETDADMESLRERATSQGKAIVGDITARDTIPIAVPLRMRGEIIGVVAWELPAADYDSNKLQLAENLVERLAFSLDNARLFEQTQLATQRERLVNEISAKLTAQADVNEILHAAVREVGEALRVPQVSIRLNREDAPDPTRD